MPEKGLTAEARVMHRLGCRRRLVIAMPNGEKLAPGLNIVRVLHPPEALLHQVESQEHVAAKLPAVEAPKDELQLNQGLQSSTLSLYFQKQPESGCLI